jgi:hypothetical protein
MADQAFAVILEVPHLGVAAWHWVADQFIEELAAQVIPPVLAADLVSEIRRGRDGLRLRIAVTVRAADAGQAVTLAWDAVAAAREAGGFDLAHATVEAGPAPLMLSYHRGQAGPRGAATPAAAPNRVPSWAAPSAPGLAYGHNRRPRRVFDVTLKLLPAVNWSSRLSWEITEQLVLFDSVYDIPTSSPKEKNRSTSISNPARTPSKPLTSRSPTPLTSSLPG